MLKQFFTAALTLAVLGACQSPSDSPSESEEKKDIFPKVKDISEMKETVFLPTLETPIPAGKNAIYAASLLMAWDEIKTAIANPILAFENEDLEQMNQSESYQNVLQEDEYETTIEVGEGIIKATASFAKSLPFKKPLRRLNEPLNFKSEEVANFGFYGKHTVGRIVYYHNNEDFAIRLRPKDREHEIILVMRDFDSNLVLEKEVQRLSETKDNFELNYTEETEWRHYFANEDEVRIPIMAFNLSSGYPDIVGSLFNTEDIEYEVTECFQRTAFVLNEKGAEVKSEARMGVKETSAAPIVAPQPKKLIFDRPYLIFLKRTDSNYPYFGMYVANSELMEVLSE